MWSYQSVVTETAYHETETEKESAEKKKSPYQKGFYIVRKENYSK